jgi:hypothetical protein
LARAAANGFIVERLIKRALRKLGEEQRDRYEEEWSAHIRETQGTVGKLIAAIGFLRAARTIPGPSGARGEKSHRRGWHIAAWPLVVKVSVLVAGLVVTVAVMTSQVVLWRFAQDQKSNLELLTGAYLDGLSAAVLPALVRRDVRGVFDALDRAQGNRYADDFEPRFAILGLPNRTILASSDPRRFPVQSVVPRRAAQAVRSRRRSRNRPQHRQRLAGQDTAHRGVSRWTPVGRGGHRRLVAGSS